MVKSNLIFFDGSTRLSWLTLQSQFVLCVVFYRKILQPILPVKKLNRYFKLGNLFIRFMSFKISNRTSPTLYNIVSDIDQGLGVGKSTYALYNLLRDRGGVISSGIAEGGGASDFWQRTCDAIKDLGNNPGVLFIGFSQAFGLVASAWTFARTFNKPSKIKELKLRKDNNSILAERVIEGFNLTGSMARLGSWIHAQFFWSAGGVLAAGILGGVGYAIGIIRGGSKAFAILDEIKQAKRLIDKAGKIGIVSKSFFKNIHWIHILNYSSNILFTYFCSLAVFSLVMYGAFFPPLAAVLLFGSLVMMLSAFFMKVGNVEEEKRLEFLKANDINREYSY